MRMETLKRNLCFLFLSFTLGLPGCKAGEIDFDAMKSSEEAFNKRQGQELIIQMPLRTMFPNQPIRTLAEAAGKGRLTKLEELVKQGVDVNARGNNDATPLFWALRNSNLKGFTRLLELGADPNLLFADGSVMHWATMHEDVAFLKVALEHGGDPNLRAGQLGETPLFLTVGLEGDNRKEHRQLLLDSGANINIRTVDDSSYMPIGGNTPIMKAAGLGRFNVVYELLELGADYKIKNDSGRDLTDRVGQKRGAFISGSQQEKDLQRVIDWLSERGVEIPPRE
ncbi:ankyrin repeat domain-containing protein [Aliidiomarina indica]|uniref:ankyrin repeat domain-containing protein n=1 Tax=Aliidiomarina indica TaxID=2749147 RepID=UPI001E58E774|nr:ankyrin repeat domain-containing protein [Aliidiomarina indica]